MAHTTFGNILADVYRRCGYAASPDSTVVTRIKSFVNETQQQILAEPGMEFLTNSPMTFASVASQAEYGLAHLSKVKHIYETTNDTRLDQMSLARYRALYPDVSAVTGTPTHWVTLGLKGVSKQPSNASRLFVDSTSAGDVGTAHIEGIRTGGYPVNESIVMTGVTAVGTTATDIIEVTKFYVSATAVGTITLVEDAEGGTVLSTIPIGEAHAEYLMIALVPTPSSAITYTVDHQCDIEDMTVDSDVPLLPAPFHRILADGARVKEYEKLNQLDRLQIANVDYQRGLARLKFWAYVQAAGNPNLRPRLSGHTFDEHVQGAWIPHN